MQTTMIGKNHLELADWLSQTWLQDGPTVCFIEGFSGVGKSSVMRRFVQSAAWEYVVVAVPEAGADQFDNLYLELATRLSEIGINDLADAVFDGRPFEEAISVLMMKKVLVVLDEFQNALDNTGRPSRLFIQMMDRLANRLRTPGRVLCLTNRLVERSKWSEPHSIRTLTRLSTADAEKLLSNLLVSAGRDQEISSERRPDVVNWLGGNPRAIHVLVASLEHSPLDDLIGINPESWEARDREVSQELLHRLERELLERTLELLDANTTTVLKRLAVHRVSVKREAIERLLPEGVEFNATRDSLVNRFLMEHHAGWFSLHPIVREIALHRLKESEKELRQAHSYAADHYMRHFRAREIKDSGKLGGYFVEARYHLVQSEREAELAEIAGRFENHLKATFSSVSPVPTQLDDLNERIATLSALLETPGSKGLEYYLARLYDARRAAGDAQKALLYVQRATGPRAPAATWVLRLKLEAEVNGSEQALRVARQGIARVPADKGLFALYQSAGELLARDGRTAEAVALLKEGIARVPPSQSLFALYQSAGELLAGDGRTGEAVALLKEGIAKVPPDKGLFSLYQSAGELLARDGRTDEAVALLKEVIATVPAGQSLFSLYQSAGELLAGDGQTDEAVALLKEGIATVPPSQSLFSLYQSAGELLARDGRTGEAVALLKQGAMRIPQNAFNSRKLVESILNLLYAARDPQQFDEFLNGVATVDIGPLQKAFGAVLKDMMLGNWLSAAQLARQYNRAMPFYRPLRVTEAFCWLCVGDANAAYEAQKEIVAQERSFDPVYWLRAWIALKQGSQLDAQRQMALYLGQPEYTREVTAELLLSLWYEVPAVGGREDIAYQFAVLPASLTGLAGDLARMPGRAATTLPGKELSFDPPAPAPTGPVSAQAPGPSPDSQRPGWIDELFSATGQKPRVDIGIVIALEEEFRELAPQLEMHPFYDPEVKQYYYLFERPGPGPHVDPHRGVVTFMGSMGPTDAGMVADRLLAQFKPGTIVSIGIAGSMDPDVLVGDVVVAEQTDEYIASSKATESSNEQGWQFSLSGSVFRSDPSYVSHARNLRFAHQGVYQNWGAVGRARLQQAIGSIALNDIAQRGLIANQPQIHTGHIASGPTVGAANAFVQWLKSVRDRKFVALEMESAGVLNAAHRRAVPSLIIRGISDYSDDRKSDLDKVGKGALRRYAMNNAYDLLWALMNLRLANDPE